MEVGCYIERETFSGTSDKTMWNATVPSFSCELKKGKDFFQNPFFLPRGLKKVCLMYSLEDCIKNQRKRPCETLRHLECALLHTNKAVSKHLSDGNKQDLFPSSNSHDQKPWIWLIISGKLVILTSILNLHKIYFPF